jgi:hypothetical protein
LDEVPASAWTEPAALPGVRWDPDAYQALLEGTLRPFIEEFAPPAQPPGNEEGFVVENPFYGSLDAEVLYAMVRHWRPERVIEFGSGFSTLVIARAGKRNEVEGSPIRHEVFDPHPARQLAAIRDRIELRAVSATEVPVQQLEELRAGDLLFIDTTHVLRIGGDVVHLLLDGLPRVAAGVIVHIHDFFRPYEYPRALFEEYGMFWQEHYLVQAFLAFNDDFEILCANHVLRHEFPERLRALLPSFHDGVEPSALWLRRRT